jgi:hypothetical protein
MHDSRCVNPCHEGGFTGHKATALTLVPGVLHIFNTTHKKLKANWVQ